MKRSSATRRLRRGALGAATLAGALALAAPPAAATCCDGYAPPDLPVIILDGDTQVYEASGQAWFTLTRNQSATPLEVAVQIQHGTTNAADVSVGASWTFPAGVSQIKRVVSITQDDGVEPLESFTLRIKPKGDNGFTSADPDVTVAILDGNGPQLALIDASAPEGNAPAGGQIPVRVDASYAPLQDLTFRVRTGVFGFEAEPGVDFAPIDQLVTLPAGSTSVEVAIPIIGDDIHEDDELIPVYADMPSHGAFPVADGSAEMRILDDDPVGGGVPPAGGGASSGGTVSGSKAGGMPTFSSDDLEFEAPDTTEQLRRPVRQEVGDQLTGTPVERAEVASSAGLPLLPIGLVGGWSLVLALWALMRRADRGSGDDERDYRSLPTAAD